MPVQRVLEQDGIELWVYSLESEKDERVVHCHEGASEVIVSLDTDPPEIRGYRSDLPSGRLLNRALKIVSENRQLLINRWEENNG